MPRKQTPKTRSEKHPLAERVRTTLRKVRSETLVDLTAVREARQHAESLQQSFKSLPELSELHPLHAIYVYAQNQISILVEQLGGLRELKPLARLLEDAEDTYLPEGPPMSPLTRSYFTNWAFFDAAVGKERETFGTILLDLADELRLDRTFTELLRQLQSSRMGLYRHQGRTANGVLLRELGSAQVLPCIVPSGYVGRAGELWFVRVVPPLDGASPEHLVPITPYVITQPTDESAWRAFLQRTLPRLRDPDLQKAHELLMKFGLSPNMWNEYIFEAYLNHQSDVIFLQGLPDVALSRPHSRESENQSDWPSR